LSPSPSLSLSPSESSYPSSVDNEQVNNRVDDNSDVDTALSQSYHDITHTRANIKPKPQIIPAASRPTTTQRSAPLQGEVAGSRSRNGSTSVGVTRRWSSRAWTHRLTRSGVVRKRTRRDGQDSHGYTLNRGVEHIFYELGAKELLQPLTLTSPKNAKTLLHQPG
jgi:hypothetical protein